MSVWISAADQQRGAAVVDWIPVFVPVAAIIAAVIAATAARMNARKQPQERLEQLVKILKDWPEGVEGRDTVVHEVALVVAEIRLSSADRTPATDEPERQAEAAVLLQAAKRLIVGALSSILLAGGAIAAIVGSLVWGQNGTPGWYIWLSFAAIVAGGLVSFVDIARSYEGTLRERLLRAAAEMVLQIVTRR